MRQLRDSLNGNNLPSTNAVLGCTERAALPMRQLRDSLNGNNLPSTNVVAGCTERAALPMRQPCDSLNGNNLPSTNVFLSAAPNVQPYGRCYQQGIFREIFDFGSPPIKSLIAYVMS